MNGADVMEEQQLPKLLLVEDDLGFVNLVECALREHYWVDAVSRLAEAIEALAHETYVGVLLDLNLLDSRELGTLDRLMPHCGTIPVVGLTGMLGMSRHGRGYVLCEKNWMDWTDLPTQLRALFRQAQKGHPRA
ncbi:MAG TPA: hypothetical protein VIH59_29055 [Candidatus Tectomicrobia bacterium]|jgi:DNA-binding response OmpR family regulator